MEAWLRGPVPGVPALLQPAAHALQHAREDAHAALDGVAAERLWASPGGAASIGYHLRHLVGALDRLYTYARGEELSATQLAALAREADPGRPLPEAATLAGELDAAIDHALDQLRETDDDTLLDACGVGRLQLPSTVLGLLMHGAEHAARHAGQARTTAIITKG
jgi:uncharacterized damage-inducible protein DinB